MNNFDTLGKAKATLEVLKLQTACLKSRKNNGIYLRGSKEYSLAMYIYSVKKLIPIFVKLIDSIIVHSDPDYNLILRKISANIDSILKSQTVIDYESVVYDGFIVGIFNSDNYFNINRNVECLIERLNYLVAKNLAG